MKRSAVFALSVIFVVLAQQPAAPPKQGGGRAPAPSVQPTVEERRQIQTNVEELDTLVKGLRAHHANEDLVADVGVYAMSGRILLEFPEDFFTQDGITMHQGSRAVGEGPASPPSASLTITPPRARPPSSSSPSRLATASAPRCASGSTRYNQDYWVTLDPLEKHYEHAEVDVQRNDSRKRYHITTKNLARLTLRETEHAEEIQIDGKDLHVKGAPLLALEKSPSGWQLSRLMKVATLHKVHGLQGPIDDAFLDPFLLVRPTGTAWNQAVNQQALHTLARFDRL